MIDVDQFKIISDTFGHLAGDRALKKIGGIINEVCRAEDVARRIGGGEFAIIAPHTNSAEAEILADRIRQILADTHLKSDLASTQSDFGDAIRVTASFGVADATSPYDRSMLERGDFAMYRAKQAGRNCVTTAKTIAAPRPIAA